MSDKRSHHGNTPAAWTTVTIALIGFVVGGVGIVIGEMLYFWVGVGLNAAALAIGKLMQMAGLGQYRK